MESINAPPLNHYPPSTWTCYAADGASAAGSSNLAWGGTARVPGTSVHFYVNESGNGLGHRRWCLAAGLKATYFGAADSATCMHSLPSTGDVSNPLWIAYPNPGFAPVENFGVWSVQSEVLGFAAATVTVQDEATGTPLSVTQITEPSYYAGEALGWTPNGWSPVANTTYRVTITGASGAPGPISWTTTPVQCL
jgi:hypothetical protein